MVDYESLKYEQSQLLLKLIKLDIDEAMLKTLYKAGSAELEKRAKNTEHNRVINFRGKIQDMSVDGKIFVVVWSRDCDMCESTTLRQIPANYFEYEKFEERQYDGAEGPVSIRIISAEEAKEFEPSFRDRVAEAWDNGNTRPYIV